VLYDASGEYHARIEGFGGKEKWYGELKAGVDRGAGLREARAKAASDPAAWVEVARLLAEVPDREKDALDAYGKVPLEKADAKVAAAVLALKGRMAWEKAQKALNERFEAYRKGIDPADVAAVKAAVENAYRELAPKVREEMDAFIAEFPSTEEAANALLQKARVLMKSDLVREGLEAGKQFLAKYPEHRAAKGLRNWIEQVEKDLEKAAEPAGGEGK